LFRRRKSKPNNTICFHCQQCVEKLMKAVPVHNKVVSPHSHDLPTLSDLIKQVDSTWFWDVQELRLLTKAAVVFRYPGTDADRREAKISLALCRRLRDRLKGMVR
jgi:HEPN domain-containing protein